MNRLTNIPQGYKSSPLGIIPKDWEVKRLGEIGIFVKGYGVPKDHIKKVGHPCLTYGDLYTKYNVVIKNIQSFIDDEDAATSQKIYNGDILFAGSGETPEDIGKCAAYIDKQVAYAGGDIIILRPTMSYNNLVLSYILNFDIGGKQRYQMAQGHSVVHIYPCNLEKINIPLPPLAEQERIAELLGTWDRAIEMQKQLIDKLELRKKGLMQQLLTGKKRLKGFTEPWVEKQLCEVFDFFKGNGLSKEKICPDGIYKCMLYGEIFTQFNYITRGQFHRTNYNEGFLSKSGDVLMPGSTTTNGYDLVKAVAINQDNIFLGGDIIILRKRDIRDDSLFWATLISEIERQKIAEKTQGITIIHLHAKNLMDIKYKVPTLYTEQTAIANVLSALDNEIQKLAEKRDKYIEEKKGLMQILLTGKKRI